MDDSKNDKASSSMMSEAMLKGILEEIKRINQRMDSLEWLIMDLKIPIVEPTPEEQEIIEEYEKDKESGKLEFKEFI